MLFPTPCPSTICHPHRFRTEKSFGVCCDCAYVMGSVVCIEETLDCIYTDFPIHSPSSNAPSVVGFLFAVSESKEYDLNLGAIVNRTC